MITEHWKIYSTWVWVSSDSDHWHIEDKDGTKLAIIERQVDPSDIDGNWKVYFDYMDCDPVDFMDLQRAKKETVARLLWSLHACREVPNA